MTSKQANTTAVSSTGSANQQSTGLIGSLTPIILMVVVFYFLIIRPQQKREAKKRDLINSLKKGDRILTISGIIGTLHKIGEKEISLEVDEDLRIRMLKSSIAEVLEKNSELGKEGTEAFNSNVTSKSTAKKKVPNKK